jgi:hypothetical protein
LRIRTDCLLFVLPLILLVSLFPQTIAGPIQPPVVSDTLYVGTIGWGPRRADPTRAYDTGSGELMFNVYDNLMIFGEAVSNNFKSDWLANDEYWKFLPALAENVPTRSELIQDFVGISPINATNLAGTNLTHVPPDGNDYIIYGWGKTVLTEFSTSMMFYTFQLFLAVF